MPRPATLLDHRFIEFLEGRSDALLINCGIADAALFRAMLADISLSEVADDPSTQDACLREFILAHGDTSCLKLLQRRYTSWRHAQSKLGVDSRVTISNETMALLTGIQEAFNLASPSEAVAYSAQEMSRTPSEELTPYNRDLESMFIQLSMKDSDQDAIGELLAQLPDRLKRALSELLSQFYWNGYRSARMAGGKNAAQQRLEQHPFIAPNLE